MFKARVKDLDDELNKLRNIQLKCPNCACGLCQRCNRDITCVTQLLALARQDLQNEQHIKAGQHAQAQVQAPALALGGGQGQGPGLPLLLNKSDYIFIQEYFNYIILEY